MIGRWRAVHKDVFIRDLLRDYCRVHVALTEQAERLAHSGTVSYAVLCELLGEAMRKGVFWRLKDTAHHLFRIPNDSMSEADVSTSIDAVEHMLDWCIGYTFHECAKLREDAFQRQHYTNRLSQMCNNVKECEPILTLLEPLTHQTHESMKREMTRIIKVLDEMGTLLLRYLAGRGDNGHVARFLVAEEDLVQKCFGTRWKELLYSLYGDSPEQLYVSAARAYIHGGRYAAAEALVARATNEGLFCQDLQELIEQNIAITDAEVFLA